MKIVVCGLVRDDNLGEHFIAKSLEWLILDELKNETDNIEFCEADIFARTDVRKTWNTAQEYKENNYQFYDKDHQLVERIYDAIGRYNKNLKHFKNCSFVIRHFLWKIGYNYKRRYMRYFRKKFQDADLIAIDGAGLLEYSFNEYQEMLYLICKLAEEMNIPVIFNAIGRAGEFDPKDYRCKILMKAFKKKSVKYISARDSENSVQECVGEKFKVKLLADAALWADKAYGINKNSIEKSVGIGLIRDNAMLSYGNGINSDELVNLISSIALELKRRGYKFTLFTNGMIQDYETGVKVLEKLNLDKSYLVERPTEGRQLMETISKFEGIITFRMHSAIAAFSMGIPSVILSWNDKVNKFMDICGYRDRAINQDKFDPEYIVDIYEKAILEGVNEKEIKRMKAYARESVADYIHTI